MFPHGKDTTSTSFTLPEPLPNRFSAMHDFFRQTLSHFQRQTVNQCLASAEVDLKAYQAEINRLQATLILLKGRRDDLQGAITRYRSLLSPIRRMPPEVLTYIFSCCCDTNVIEPGKPLTAMSLSNVCGSWRKLVLASPRLWSSLTLELSTWTGESSTVTRRRSRQFCHLTKLLMERSKGQLLSLEFPSPESNVLEPFEAGINCLLMQSDRWRRLGFHGFNEDPLILSDSPFQRLKGCLPKLEHLFLNFGDCEEEGLMASDLALFKECSRLKSIHVRSGIISAGFNCDFPWSQIQSLELSRTDSDNVLHMTPLCTSVQRLKVDCNCVVEASEIPRTTLPETKHVSICGSEDQGLFFFGAFSLPSLSSLEIRGHPYFTPSHWNLDTLTNFFIRSSCPIVSLDIGDLVLSDTEALQLLALLPTLTELSIQDRQFPVRVNNRERPPKNKIITKAFLERLAFNAEDSHSGSFLPRLTDLTLTTFPLKPSVREVLERALASRLNGLRAFTVVIVPESPEQQVDMSEYDSLQCFTDAGMRVRCSFRKRESAE